jgi:hypothetical protein
VPSVSRGDAVFTAGFQHRLIGGAGHLLDRDGTLTVTIPKSTEASADDLAPTLAAV